MIIVAAHAPARTVPGFPAYLGSERARAYQGFDAPAINSTRPASRCFARPALAHPGVGTVAVGTAHTPGLTGPGLPACLRPGCSCAYQAPGTLGIGPAPIARRDAAHTVTAANQQIGAIIIGTARIPDIAPRAARADPGYTHQTIRAMAIDTAQGTADTCAGLPAYPGTGLSGTYQPIDTFAIGGTGTALGYLGGAAPCPGGISLAAGYNQRQGSNCNQGNYCRIYPELCCAYFIHTCNLYIPYTITHYGIYLQNLSRVFVEILERVG